VSVLTDPVALMPDQVNADDAYALSVGARYFNVTESAVKKAVHEVGEEPLKMREQLENL
jgi:hypothetical protein